MSRSRTLLLRLMASVPFQVLGIALVSRLALAFAGWYMLKLIPPPWTSRPTSLLAWAQWDAAHYARIALNGYNHPSDSGSAAFFPLYPMIVRVIGRLTGRSDTTVDLLGVGVVVAGIFFLLSVVLLVRLFELHLGSDIARTASVLLVVSPYSFFFTAGYTESLFMTLIALTFLLAYRQHWLLAAIVIALATATRVTGVFLIPTLLYMAWRNRESVFRLVMISVVSPLGLIAYMAYTWWSLREPFAFLKAQQGWGGFHDRTWTYVEGFIESPATWFFAEPGNPVMLINVALFLLWSLSLIPMARLVPLEILVFSGLVILQTVVSIQSMGRYLLPAIGVYMATAILLHRSRHTSMLRDAVVIPSAVLLTLLFMLFAEAEWIV